MDDEGVELIDSRDDTANTPVIPRNDTAYAGGQHYPTRACRSVVGNQPYDAYAPRTAFLQLGTVQAHRSVLEASRLLCMTKEEQMMATMATTNLLKSTIDIAVHKNDLEMTATSKDKIKVWVYLMTQYNLKPGLKKFGKRGKTAAMKELMQLHVMDTWTDMDPTKLSREQQMKALLSLLFLKEKITGYLKGCACINGAPQRAYIPKEEAGLPTVSTELTFIMASIAASKRRTVQCYDIPSMFVNTDVDEDVLMVLKGELAKMMVQIAPQVYRKYVPVDRKGMKILCSPSKSNVRADEVESVVLQEVAERT
jgi:hypothetical protein